jgi:hypothetical protein
MNGIEYRVRWQRVGARLKERRYARRGMAVRQLEFLLSPDHARCDHGGGGPYEPPYCVWSRGMGGPDEPPPWLVRPVLESRDVGPWS